MKDHHDEEESYVSAREFSRVDACIPFDYRPVLKEKQEAVKSRVSREVSFIQSPPLPELENEPLAAWLKTLNSKLDSIISLLTYHREGFLSLPMRNVNISGGGMSFSTGEKHRPGDILEIKMMLHLLQPVALYLYGEVVYCDEREGRYLTGIKFIEMDEEVTNEIVKFVFEVQRGILREKRRESAS
ncbi:MAG: PilZ domain-containing protein [Syntrophales bacterium]